MGFRRSLLLSCSIVLAVLGAPVGQVACAQEAAAATAARSTDVRSPVEPRPASATAQAAAMRLFQAIVHDDPQLATEAFFPRSAFVKVKAMQRPERYYDKLLARFVADIHRLHRDTPELADAEFVALELGHRGGWVVAGEEGNRLPYWAARHTTLRYRVRGQVRALEVRVLITWEQRWYIIHLREFH